ncbi:MotE family protein [Eubacterium xylanophilum]|uniref:MotE family protein n=1 Tax=Eubacterium xylanophilum TaxID=39497 RepID=UPI00047BB396|nr:hypothetical protein [Eubacterium xylanophilum]MCR5797217.1 hypothetical protein [Eubacterium sp.]
MADKNKDADNTVEKEEGAGSKVLTIVIVLLIILIWLAAFVALVKMDVGGFGSEVLAPVVKDVPVVNMILPSKVTEEKKDPSLYTNLDEANAKIKDLEAQLAKAKSSGSASSDEVKELKAEVDRLKKFESQQRAFEQRVKEFDEGVVYNDKAPELEEYKKYYEQISPDNAENIYKKVLKDYQHEQAIKKQGTVYSKMDAKKAAAVLETMATDIGLVAKILDTMTESKSAAILNEMTPETAAQITTKMTSK